MIFPHQLHLFVDQNVQGNIVSFFTLTAPSTLQGIYNEDEASDD